MTPRFVVTVTLSLCAAAALMCGVSLRAGQQSSAASGSALTGNGRTATPLPDGRVLLIGGNGVSGPENGVLLFDSATQTTIRLPARMREARAWHTATIVATGAILISGGLGADGHAVASVERFDLATETLTAVEMSGAAARAGHTATLLTDGRVLVVGGEGDRRGVAADAEIWDVDAGAVTQVAGLQPRSGHTAALLADGRVLLSGGAGMSGARVDIDDEFDPRSGRGKPMTIAPPDQPGMPPIAESQPRAGDRDVPLDARVTIRFSRTVEPATLTAQSIQLSGTRGPVATHIVVAENGRLAFAWPLNPLQPETAYRLTIANLRDSSGVPLATDELTFETVAAAKSTQPDDEEVWTPDASDPDSWRTHRDRSPWQMLAPLQAEPGVTAVAGQVLTLNGRPLRDVTLEIDDDSARTDSTGRFLLRVSNAGSDRHEMGIDGSTANRATKKYGFFEYGATVEPGKTNVLPFTIWMPRLDVAHEVTIPSPTVAETVITTPYIPGLELHLPPRTTIHDEEGRTVTRVGITPIPVDRPPFPLAKNVEVPVYFTIQPGGGYVRTYGTGSRGAWLVYPNYRQAAPGQVVQFFHYDPEDKDWYVYGIGKVTPNATQVVPDSTTRLYEFTGAMINTGDPLPGGGWTPGGPGWSDPVDPSTGIFGLHKTDLYLPDVMPLALTRTYNSADTAARPFGRGMTHPYAMFLWSAQQWQEADLVLPEGRIHFIRTSAGTGWADAVFVHQETPTTSATPTVWYKSVMTWNGNGWNLQRTDGMLFVFGENAPLQRIRDRYGNTVSITRTNGQTGNITRVTSPSGRWIAFYYDSSNRITQASDNIGRTVRYSYNAAGNLETVTDGENAVTTYAWTPSNQLSTMSDPRNIVFLRNTYTNGRVTAQATGDGSATTQFGYTLGAAGEITHTDITDPRGRRERLAFNGDHYVISDVRAVGLPEQQTIAFERQTGSNFVTAVIDALGRRAEFQYDGFGHVVRQTALAGTAAALTTAMTYEQKFFQPASIADPLGHVWSFSYDALARLTGVTDPVGRRSAVTLDANGRITSVTDALQHAWRFAYRGADLASVTDPLNAVHTVFSDVGGRVVAATDPLGFTTRFSWNSLNQIASATDAAGGRKSWTYDGNGNTLEFTDALGHTTTYSYDPFDRLAARTDPVLQTESWQYDANDNLARSVDRNGQTITYQYDALDRLTLITFADNSTIAYTHDAGDRVVQVTDSLNGTVSWRYDLLDRLTQESTPFGTVDYTYDADGRRTAMTVSGQVAVSYTYDDSHRLTGIVQGSAAVALAYDEAGRRSSLTYPNGVMVTYAYDAADRVTNLAYSLGAAPIGDLAYTYDLVGNRTGMDGSLARTGLPAAVAGASYDAANRISVWSGRPFAYDANGNVTSDGLHTFGWNARNLLTSVSGGVSGMFQYDALGRRRARTAGGATTRFVYDGLNIVQEQTASGAPAANLLTGMRLDETFMRTDGATNMLLTDALGSTVSLVDTSGAVGTEYTYDAYGGTTATGPASSNSAQFTGRENDGTGFYYYRARYYAPELGRFLSEDPLEFGSGDENLYAYVGNRPTSANDPLGLYNRDVHFDMTGQIGLQIGMCAANAWEIAGANQGIDDDLWTSPTVIPNVWARSMLHFTTAERRSQLRRLAFGTGSRYAMGVYLHALQDSYSHQHGRKDRDGTPYGPVLGHAMDWKGPDDPRNRPELWRRMQQATARELWQFHQKNPLCRTR